MPRELRVSISVAVPLPENPSRMAAAILEVDRAVDELRQTTGGVVESESEIVTPRVKREEPASDSQMTLVTVSGAYAPGPVVGVPPMYPAPVVGPPPLVHHEVRVDIPAPEYREVVPAEDLLAIPKFLERTA